MAFNDAVDQLITAQLSQRLTDPSEAQARKQVVSTMLQSQEEDLKRQRVETIGLISDKLTDNDVPESVKQAYESLLEAWSK